MSHNATLQQLRFKTDFTLYIVRENALDRKNFASWAFYPGMLFESPDKWWGDLGKRNTPHEGLDIRFYMDSKGRSLSLNEKTKIPVMFDGTIVKITNDFLGKTIIMAHDFSDLDKGKFCTIYGHITPYTYIYTGQTVIAGEVIATLADTSLSSSGIPPHLHVSVGWVPENMSYDRLDWKMIGGSNLLTLMDPIDMISSRDQILVKMIPDNSISS